MKNSTNITSKQQSSKRDAAPTANDSVQRFKTQKTLKKTDNLVNDNTEDNKRPKVNAHPEDEQDDKLIENLIDQYCMENIFDSDDEAAGCCFDYSSKLSDKKEED